MKKSPLTDAEKREINKLRQREWRKNNPDKVKAQRDRQRAKAQASNPDYLETTDKVGGRWTTGYSRGRPKADEQRPESPNAIAQRKYRKDNDKWKEYNRKKQAEWAANNPERRREISREYYARKKEREGQILPRDADQ